jgi:histone demethylase JARID1
MSNNAQTANPNGINNTRNTRLTAAVDEQSREGERPPDLGIQPIAVPAVLDLNSVRTRTLAPRPPPASAAPDPPIREQPVSSAFFVPPPEAIEVEEPPRESNRPFGIEDCPEFYPTKEEWGDPMRYIRKIHKKAEAYGLCKIVPPEDWKMPFVTDTEVGVIHSVNPGFTTNASPDIPFQNPVTTS